MCSFPENFALSPYSARECWEKNGISAWIKTLIKIVSPCYGEALLRKLILLLSAWISRVNKCGLAKRTFKRPLFRMCEAINLSCSTYRPNSHWRGSLEGQQTLIKCLITKNNHALCLFVASCSLRAGCSCLCVGHFVSQPDTVCFNCSIFSLSISWVFLEFYFLFLQSSINDWTCINVQYKHIRTFFLDL